MMQKLSFKEYYDAKEKLRLAANSNQTVNSEYEMQKYCKFPVQVEGEDKEYISLKPKDRISILWEFINTGTGTPDQVPRRVEIITEDDESVRVSPCWGKSKLINWIQKNTVENN